ncbi:hypothetical protein D3C75_1019580 [compost metagenome]
MTLRTAYSDVLHNRLRIAAVRESGAGQELSEPSKLIYHRFPAFLAKLIGHFIFNLNLFHFFFGKQQPLLKRFVKSGQNFYPILCAFFHMVKIPFHVCCEFYIENFREELFHLLYNQLA